MWFQHGNYAYWRGCLWTSSKTPSNDSIRIIIFLNPVITGRGGAEPPARRVADRDTHNDRDGGNHNTDRSPAHPYGNRGGARETGRGAASPAWDRRGRHPSGGDEGSVMAPGTPKIRQRQGGRPEEPVREFPSYESVRTWKIYVVVAGANFFRKQIGLLTLISMCFYWMNSLRKEVHCRNLVRGT